MDQGAEDSKQDAYGRTAALDHIRSNFRNPTDHPEKIYDIEEVQDLLNVRCDAISRMVTGKRL